MKRFVNNVNTSGKQNLWGRGFMSATLLFFVVGCAIQLLITGCQMEIGNKKKKEDQKDLAAPVVTEVVGTGEISSYQRLNGVLDPVNEVKIYAQTLGNVLQITCEEGSLVAKDQILVFLDDADQQLSLKRTGTLVEREQENFNRASEMHQKELISDDDFKQLQISLQDAQLAYEQATLALDRTKIRAPFTGLISERNINPGDRVDLARPLFALVDQSKLLIDVWMTEQDVSKISVGTLAEVLIHSNRELIYPVSVLRISPVVDRTFGKIKVTFEVHGDRSSLKPGQFVEIRLKLETRQNVIVVPKRSIIYENGLAFVFVTRDSLAHRKAVKLGLQTGENVEISDGLLLGEQLVTEGQVTLQDSSLIKTYQQSEGELP